MTQQEVLQRRVGEKVSRRLFSESDDQAERIRPERTPSLSLWDFKLKPGPKRVTSCLHFLFTVQDYIKTYGEHVK